MMLSTMKFLAAFLTSSLCLESASALSLSPSTKQQKTISRRDAAASIFSIGVTTTTAFFTPIAQNANAAEDNQVLSDEEMAARIARKMELLQKSKAGGGGGGGGGVKSPYADIRSDVNPEAAVNLRSRSAVDNAKIAIEKQKELKSRDNAKKREDLCEMLGRGC
mmetsp:Transcript_26252/g.37492  ORF Transcript_26252/g.37492 Transcript_26252/m.37492 type:complete len:164 (+) Transcript_26252:34-525(+)